jgi:hypothetical protein
VDLLDSVGYPVPDAVRSTARTATQFAAALAPPDDRIPLLNDAVRGEALAIPAVLDYAERVGVRGRDSATARSAGSRGLPSSGYYWLGTGDDRLLVDGGPAGPDHLPGHAHNDFLQVLLWVDGRRLVTDTGVYDYAPGAHRQTARSVRSHNTVQVGRSEPVDVGGRYLMGRRTEPTVAYHADDRGAAFDGRYEVPSGFGRAYAHRRRVVHRPSWWLVWDDVELGDPDTVHSRLHIAPDADVAPDADIESDVEVECGGGECGGERGGVERRGIEDAHWDGETRLGDDRLVIESGSATCWLHPLSADDLDLTTTSYYPEFGVEQRRRTIDIRVRSPDSDHASVGFLASTEPRDEVTLDRSGDRLDGLWLDDEYEPLPRVTDPDLLDGGRDDA